MAMSAMFGHVRKEKRKKGDRHNCKDTRLKLQTTYKGRNTTISKMSVNIRSLDS